MKKKVIKWGHGHVLQCRICFEMERRGYRSESKYWDDFFAYKEKPIKYRIFKGWGNKEEVKCSRDLVKA